MKFTIEKRTTNVRPSKTEAPEVSTTPTAGNFKINQPGADVLGVKHGDYIDVVEGSVEGVKALYVAKGKAPIKDEAGKTIETAVGAKLASANGKLAGTLQASSANTYTALNGNKEENLVYSIDVENPQVDDESGVTYYALTLVRREPKQVKKSA